MEFNHLLPTCLLSGLASSLSFTLCEVERATVVSRFDSSRVDDSRQSMAEPTAGHDHNDYLTVKSGNVAGDTNPTSPLIESP